MLITSRPERESNLSGEWHEGNLGRRAEKGYQTRGRDGTHARQLYILPRKNNKISLYISKPIKRYYTILAKRIKRYNKQGPDLNDDYE